MQTKLTESRECRRFFSPAGQDLPGKPYRVPLARSLLLQCGKETTMSLMWIENHLILLGLLAVLSGLGLGALWSRAQRNAGSTTVSGRPSSAPSAAEGSSTTGTGSVRPRYQARSW